MRAGRCHDVKPPAHVVQQLCGGPAILRLGGLWAVLWACKLAGWE